MSRNCLRHLAATVKILEPTLCIIQGVPVAGAIASIIGRREPVAEGLERVQLAGVEKLLAAYTHPSAQRLKHHWGRLTNTPYLWEVVVPTMREARRVLAGASEA